MFDEKSWDSEILYLEIVSGLKIMIAIKKWWLTVKVKNEIHS